MMYRYFFSIFFLLCSTSSLFAQTQMSNPVEEVLKTLTLEEKIAQLITIRSFAEGDSVYFAKIAGSVKKYGVGGVCFFKGTPHGLVYANNLYQASSKIPLLVSIDGEWGVAMRLDSVSAFPRQQTLGAMNDDNLIFQMGERVAEQCIRLGIHINFIPCVDVNSNPKNPVINTRSFGENRVNVANKGIAYMRGLQSKNVLGSAKHFPGHGDTDVDSHYDLPIIKHPFSRIDSLDLFPFKMLIKNGVWSVMVAHLNIPALDTSPYPSSVSPLVVDSLLKRDLGFKGMVFTDGLEMNAFAKYGRDGAMELRALQAGVDNLLLPVNTEKTIETIAKAVRSGRLSENAIDEKCRKILQAKYDLGILKSAPTVSSENLLRDLNTPQITQLNKEIYANAITVLENKNEILPVNAKKYKRIANIRVGDTGVSSVFQNVVSQYCSADAFSIHRDFSDKLVDSIVQLFSGHDLLIVSVNNTNMLATKNYGITPQSIRLIERLASLDCPMILTVFASPYAMNLFSDQMNVEGLIVAYQEQSEALEVAAHGIFGANALKGRLPVTASSCYPHLTGISIPAQRFPLVHSPYPALDDTRFLAIDERLQKAIADSVFPGCQVFVAKNGEVVYNKTFGTHTYGDTAYPVLSSDLYDVASITKMAATTLALMKLYDEKKFDFDDEISEYLHYLKRSNKSELTIRQILAHQAGLRASVTTHKDLDLFCETQDEEYSIQVANNLYTSENALEKLREEIVESPVARKKTYLYSDLGFYLMADLVRELSGKSLDEYVTENFYIPLELEHTAFNPLRKFPLSQIVPTEEDLVFRKQLVHGFVHDPTVAMQGGVGGSAGLFANAEDLAVLMQMLLNGGEYGGKRYISKETIELFTNPILPNNRRGAGFDKPNIGSTNSPACEQASAKSFGHSGFTGTLLWADPENQMIYVFLSNRVNPTAANNKLAKQNIRTEIMRMFYECR